MKKILIVDDHALIREGLKKFINSTRDMLVVAEASSAEEVFDKLAKTRVDLVILDISLPDRNGLDVLKQIKKEYPRIPVLMQSMYPEDRFALKALQSGAAGYITKEALPDDLLEAIQKVFQGGKYISTNLAEQLATNLDSRKERPLHESLSEREFQVLCLLATGKKPKEIAKELVLSIHTVNTYRSRILAKMKMTRDAELIRYAVQMGLVE